LPPPPPAAHATDRNNTSGSISGHAGGSISGHGTELGFATEIESLVAAAWEAELGLPAHSVGPHSNFFSLGGEMCRIYIYMHHINRTMNEYVHIYAFPSTYIEQLYEARPQTAVSTSADAAWTSRHMCMRCNLNK